MPNLKEMTVKRVVYWLTDHKNGPTILSNLWIFIPFTSICLFIGGEISEVRVVLVIALIMSVFWVYLSLAYLLWRIARDISFLRFKKSTQHKDDPFEVRHVSGVKKED